MVCEFIYWEIAVPKGEGGENQNLKTNILDTNPQHKSWWLIWLLGGLIILFLVVIVILRGLCTDAWYINLLRLNENLCQGSKFGGDQQRSGLRLSLTGNELSIEGGNTIVLPGSEGPQGKEGLRGEDGAGGPKGDKGSDGTPGPIVVSNLLVNDGSNSITSTINGVSSAPAPIINTSSLTLLGNNLTSTVNGVASAAVDLSTLQPSACLDTSQYICQNGNSFGTTAVIGTNDNQDLELRTNGSTNMTVSASGRVGIGTTTPQGFLEVTNPGGSGGVPTLLVTSSLDEDILSIYDRGRTELNSYSAGGPTLTLNNGAGNALLEAYGTSTFTTVDSQGFLGVGASPTSLLEIGSGALTVNGATGIAVASAGTGRIYYDSTNNAFQCSENGGSYFQCFASSTPGWLLTGNTAGAGDYLGTNNAQDLRIRTNNTLRFTISQSAATLTGSGATTLTATAGSALNLDSGTTGAVNIGTGASAKTISIGNATGATAVNTTSGTGGISLLTTTSGALQLRTGTTGAVTLDSGTTGAVNVGTGSNAKTVTVGNTTSTTALALNSGTGNVTLTTPSTTFQNTTATDDQIRVLVASGGAARFAGTITSQDLTAARTWTFPNTTGIVILDTTLCTTAFCQGGNSFGAAARLGTNDLNELQFETNNVQRAVLTTAGFFGIGTTTPEFVLDVSGNGGIIARGTFGSGTTLTTAGAGTRSFWYPRKAAFRAGRVDGIQWDDANIGDYSVAFGQNTTASGARSMAWGDTTTASGSAATAWGDTTTAGSTASTAWGTGSQALTRWDTAWGRNTLANSALNCSLAGNAQAATAWGNATQAIDCFATAFGSGAIASNDRATAFGLSTTASGQNSTAFGDTSVASGADSTAMGFTTVAGGRQAFAFGYQTQALNRQDTSWGYNTVADASAAGLCDPSSGGVGAATAWGNNTDALACLATAFGLNSQATGLRATAWGDATTASSTGATAWGDTTTATAQYATAWGIGADALTRGDTAWGRDTLANSSLNCSLAFATQVATAFGRNTQAIDCFATAWGDGAIASNDSATAFGNLTAASGQQSTAMGSSTTASGTDSFAFGLSTLASGRQSTTFGSSTQALDRQDTAWGIGTLADASASGSCSPSIIGYGGATAWGRNTDSTACMSTAWGEGTLASGNRSTAWGDTTVASGSTSTAFGQDITVSGTESVGIGLGSGGPYTVTQNNTLGIMGGNVGIGTGTPVGVAALNNLQVTGGIRVGTLGAATATNVCINGSGDLSACTSSLRYKENVENLGLGLDTVLNLRAVKYDWKGTGETDFGFIAEEVAAINGLLATYDKEGQIQGVKYDQLTALLTNAIQEQQGRLDSVNNELAEIGLKLDTISAELKTLAGMVEQNTTDIEKLKQENVDYKTKLEDLETRLRKLEQTP